MTKPITKCPRPPDVPPTSLNRRLSISARISNTKLSVFRFQFSAALARSSGSPLRPAEIVARARSRAVNSKGKPLVRPVRLEEVLPFREFARARAGSTLTGARGFSSGRLFAFGRSALLQHRRAQSSLRLPRRLRASAVSSSFEAAYRTQAQRRGAGRREDYSGRHQ